MPEKDFEKQVREKMEELKLRPGEPVWDRIERTISKKKRRRLFIVLPLVAGFLLLGYTGYRIFLYKGATGNVGLVKHLQTEKNNSTPLNKNNDSIIQQKNIETTAKEPGTAVTHPDQQPEDQNTGKSIDRKASGKEVTPPAQEPDTRKIVKAPVQVTNLQKREAGRKSTSKQKRMKDDRKERMMTKKSAGDKNLPLAGEKMDSVAGQSPIKWNDQAPIDKLSDSVVVSSSIQRDSAVVNKRPDSAIAVTKPQEIPIENAVKPKKSVKEKHSAFAIQLSVGVSDIRSKPLSFSKTNPSLNSTGSPISGYPQYQSQQAPSEIRPGKAYSIGLEWHRSISRRSSFSTGLQYTYFSNRVTVGTKTIQQLQLSFGGLVDRTVSNYYGGFPTEKYTNRYHFLEIPIEYHLGFSQKKKIGWGWSTGITLGWLASSNEIMYDTSRGGIYFHSNDLFNKAHLGFITGLSVRFNLKNKATFLVGPRAFLDLSRITKDGFDRNRYLFAGALLARYIFPGKTKK